jgi:hypothetical protein
MAVLAIGLAGCVQRSMTIKSDPPQALVYLEGQETGQTPCTVSFVHYGVRDITLSKKGYETKKVLEKISPPWYQIVPIDFFFETLWPFTMKDEHVLTYKLEPVKPVNQKELIDRAKEMGHRAIRVPVE